MDDYRWKSQFSFSIPYALFNKHFTELNSIYWAHVPAANTIEKNALDALGLEGAPKDYFLITTDDERRLGSTYKEWKQNYRLFCQYTRLNMLMLLSSCFETYLRTIVSLAFESKPGVLIDCPNAVDGLFLLKNNYKYGIYNDSSYRFKEYVELVCKGEWQNRINNFNKFFGDVGITANQIEKLDDMRKRRNSIGHFIGRPIMEYSAPLIFNIIPVESLSHKNLLEFFRLVYSVANVIDKYLLSKFIGSYDILKYFNNCLITGRIKDEIPGNQAKKLQKLVGEFGFRPASTEYYGTLIDYYHLSNQNDEYKYGRKAFVKRLNLMLKDNNVNLMRNGKQINLTGRLLFKILKHFSVIENPEYCKKYETPNTEYLFSERAIEFIYNKIKGCPDILDNIT